MLGNPDPLSDADGGWDVRMRRVNQVSVGGRSHLTSEVRMQTSGKRDARRLLFDLRRRSRILTSRTRVCLFVEEQRSLVSLSDVG